MDGGGGGVVPFQNKLSMFPAPHGSFAFPAHGMLQSVAEALVVPGVIVLAQTRRPKAIKKDMSSRRLSYEREGITYSIDSKGS